MPDRPVQTGPRLRLAPAGWRDGAFLMGLAGDAQGRRWLGGAVVWHRRPAVVRGWLRTAPDERLWIVRAGKRRIGMMSLTRHKDGQDMELSYQFIPAVWGQGLATEAALAVLGHARQVPGLTRVIAETQSANGPSLRLLARIGMVEEARLMRFGAPQVILSINLQNSV